jgi:SDR family mycofactocin-dependent oxidoreductase
MGVLDGKVAFVTGAARGQGRAHATTLARSGADLILLDVPHGISSVEYAMPSSEDLAQTAKLVEEQGGRAIAIEGDVRSQDSIDAAVRAGLEAFGQIDILIANAGIYSVTPFWELTELQWSEVIETNLGGVWRSAKAVTPHMIERNTGVIIMTSSVNGLEPGATYAHYCASKYGVIGLMKTVALELAPYGVRCNAICPGATDTGMLNSQSVYDSFAGHPGGTRDDLLRAGGTFHALKGVNVLDPQVTADAALWLVSDGAAAVTGIELPVDAGHLVLPHYNHNPVG